MTVSKTVHVGSTPATPANINKYILNIDINRRVNMDLSNCVDACTDVELLNVLDIFKSIIQLITILVPVILVIFVIIDIIKTVSAGDVDTKKLSKSIGKRIAAAVIVFLVYPIINFVLQITPLSNSYYISCYNCADQVFEISKSNADIAISNLKNAVDALWRDNNEQNYIEAKRLYEIARKEVSNITDKSVREQYQDTLNTLRRRIDTYYNEDSNFNNSSSSGSTTHESSSGATHGGVGGKY